jgi:hypothetical protein
MFDVAREANYYFKLRVRLNLFYFIIQMQKPYITIQGSLNFTFKFEFQSQTARFYLILYSTKMGNREYIYV